MVIIMTDCDIVVMRIDARKKALNLRDSDIENYIGAIRGTVSKWRNKNVKSYTSYLFPLAEILKTTIAYLVGETDNPNRTPATESDGLSEAQHELISLIATMTDAEIAVLVSTAEGLIASRKLRDVP